MNKCGTNLPVLAFNDMSKSLSRDLPKLEFKYFEIQLFHITDFVLLIQEMYGTCNWVLLKKNMRLEFSMLFTIVRNSRILNFN